MALSHFPHSRPVPLAQVELAPAAQHALTADVDAQVEALRATAPLLPGESWAVPRADGGLWVAAGYEALWIVVGVAAGAWRPAAAHPRPWP